MLISCSWTMKQRYRVLFATACIFLASTSILLAFRQFSSNHLTDILGNSVNSLLLPLSHSGSANRTDLSGKPNLSGSQESVPASKDGNSTLLKMAPSYIKAIMNPSDEFPRLACPVLRSDRYDYLRHNITTELSTNLRPKYFFALDLYEAAHILPRLLGSVVEAIRFLGPQNCILSIVEGRSKDGTFEILKQLRGEIGLMGATYYFNTSDIDPWAKAAGPHSNRIVRLAELRNEALRPLTSHPEKYALDTVVIFLNDVAICTEDILELVHQRAYQDADMTCAMDWVYVGADPTFYDVWVSRGMNGDSFFEIPPDGNWNSAWNLFWNNDVSRNLLHAHKPFQVFSCWNGATAFTAKPLLDGKIKFRGPSEEECFQGEPQLFAKDMWYAGHKRIAVVPSVSLEYFDKEAEKLKELKGFTSAWTSKEDAADMTMRIEWDSNPPAMVKCMTNYANQTWVPWNESLPIT